METEQKMVDGSHPEIMFVSAKTHTYVNDITAVIIHPFSIMKITEVFFLNFATHAVFYFP